MRNRELWNRRVLRGMAMGLAVSMSLVTPMTALAGDTGSAPAQVQEIKQDAPQQEPQQNVQQEPQKDVQQDVQQDIQQDVQQDAPQNTKQVIVVSDIDADDQEIVLAATNALSSEATDNHDQLNAGQDQAKEGTTVEYYEISSESQSVKQITKDEAASMTHDTTEKVETQVVEMHNYLTDADGNYVMTTDADGNEKPVELESEQISYSTLWMYEDVDGTLKEATSEQLKDRVYGYFDANGEFYYADINDEKAKAYLRADGIPNAKMSLFCIRSDNHDSVMLNEEQYAALMGQESSYTTSTVYTFNGQEYTSVEELQKALPEGTKISVLEIGLDYTKEVVKTDTRFAGDISYPQGSEIILGDYSEVTGEYICTILGIKDGVTYETQWSLSPDNALAIFGEGNLVKGAIGATNFALYGSGAKATIKYTYKDGEEEKSVTTDKVFCYAVVSLYDTQGNLIWKGDKALFDRRIEYAEGEVKFKIETKDGEILVDKGIYKVERVTGDVVDTSYHELQYYTREDRMQDNNLNFMVGDRSYQLTVSVWENKDCTVEPVTGKVIDEDTYEVTVTFCNDVKEEFDEVKIPVNLADFDANGNGILTIQYEPTIFKEKNYVKEGLGSYLQGGDISYVYGTPVITWMGKTYTLPSDVEDPTEPSDVEDPTEPSDVEDPTEPSDVEDPTEPSDVEDPTEPSDIEDPTEPSETEEPVDPSGSTSGNGSASNQGSTSGQSSSSDQGSSDQGSASDQSAAVTGTAQGEVLGAEREAAAAETTAETSAAQEEGAVLGENRVPQTSDPARPFAWLSALTAAALAVVAVYRKREE